MLFKYALNIGKHYSIMMAVKRASALG